MNGVGIGVQINLVGIIDGGNYFGVGSNFKQGDIIVGVFVFVLYCYNILLFLVDGQFLIGFGVIYGIIGYQQINGLWIVYFLSKYFLFKG